MRLGISYGVFSGLELLKPSLQNIRPFAKHIVVVWSPIATTGEPAATYAKPLLDSLVKEGLIDELIKYRPQVTTNPQGMQDNCRMKREVGRAACMNAGCTHHLIRDCDEFHDTLQVYGHISMAETFDCTLTRIREYVNTPTTRIKELTGLCVPFIQSIDKKLGKFRPFNVVCDMGRTVMDVKTWKIFTPDDLIMHHYTFVRLDENEMRRKYQGHGHCHNIGTLNEFLTWTKRFTPDQLEQVPDTFGIREYWDNEFQQWLK